MPRKPSINFWVHGEGLEMLARVGLYGADLDFRGYSVSQRACDLRPMGLLSSNEVTVIS